MLLHRLVVALAVVFGLGAMPAWAQDLPAEPYLDDGFTFFEPDNLAETVDGQRVGSWSLVSSLRVWGQNIPKRSAFKVVVRDAKGGEAAVYRHDGFPVPGPDGTNVATNIVRMRDNRVMVRLEGLVKVEVYYIDGDTDAEKLLKTYTLNVKKVERVSGTPAAARPDAAQYYFSRHGDAPAGIISRRWPGAGSYVWDGAGQKYDFNVVEILFSHSPELFDNPGHDSHLQVQVNGQPVALTDDRVYGYGPQERNYQAEQVKAPPSKTGPLLKERVQFRQYYVVLPLTWTAPGADRKNPEWLALNDHPGDWSVTWIQGTNALRTWKFKVNADGTIAQHPEETGDLRLAPHQFLPDATLVETIIPGQGTIIDARLDPAEAQAGGFYGHVWQSAEMKAAAAAIPARNIFSGNAAPAAEVTVAAASGPAPAGIIFDDASTWLTAKDHPDVQNGKPFNKGWTLEGTLRVFGPVDERDSFRLRITKQGKELANYRVPGALVRDLQGTNHQLTAHWGRVETMPLIKETGAMQLEVFRIDGQANTESLMRTLQFTIDKLTRVRGNKGTGDMDSEMYYVDAHNEAAAAVLYKHQGKNPLYKLKGYNYGLGNAVDVIWATSPTELGTHLAAEGFIRVTVDGERLTLPEDKVNTAVDYETTVTHSNWQKPNPRGGAGPYFEHLTFARLNSRLPITWGPEADREAGRVVLEEHPGEWVVEYRHDGQVIRTWKFTVNADGSIKLHPEQESMSLPAGVWFIEQAIPAGGSPADARLAPDAARRGRLFMPWATDAGKALAGTVPSKGKPAP